MKKIKHKTLLIIIQLITIPIAGAFFTYGIMHNLWYSFLGLVILAKTIYIMIHITRKHYDLVDDEWIPKK
jgi:hypothetical protein